MKMFSRFKRNLLEDLLRTYSGTETVFSEIIHGRARYNDTAPGIPSLIDIKLAASLSTMIDVFEGIFYTAAVILIICEVCKFLVRMLRNLNCFLSLQLT